jgi:hypothetical protein
MENEIEILKTQNKALVEKVQRLMREIEEADKRAESMEFEKPYVLMDSLVGAVVPLVEYNKLQLASAKARTFLQTKVDRYSEVIQKERLGAA